VLLRGHGGQSEKKTLRLWCYGTAAISIYQLFGNPVPLPPPFVTTVVRVVHSGSDCLP